MSSNFIDDIVSEIVDKYLEQTIQQISTEEGFVHAFTEAYHNALEKRLRPEMIVNSANYAHAVPIFDKADVVKMQDMFKIEIYKKLYLKKYISEEEYKELCPKT